ncbi:MAG TPA: GerMN domain-containing protein [Thermoanaerobacterales bacterium]|nr:GerMN domain-containing protein [Thermoanaerobacterales bacterium]
MPKLARSMILFSIILILLIMVLYSIKPLDKDEGKPVTPQAQTVTLYFLDSNGKQLVPEERQIIPDKNLYESIIREIIAGPKEPGILPVISLKAGEEILESVQPYDTGGIAINFKKEAKEYLDGSPAFIEAMVLSLTQLKGVNKIAIEVNNKPYDDGNNGIYVRTVKTGSIYVSKSRQEYLKSLAESGKGNWLYDPVAVARREAGAFGFLPDDEYTLVSKKDSGEGSGTGEAYVNVKHGEEQYTIRLIQPYGPGEKSLWVLNSISKKVTPIPEANPQAGEAFIYGRVKSIDPAKRLIVIEREYMDSPDLRVKAGPDIYVLPGAIIHYQKKVRVSASEYEYNEYDVDFGEIKINDELGIIITGEKKARAIIISDRQ